MNSTIATKLTAIASRPLRMVSSPSVAPTTRSDSTSGVTVSAPPLRAERMFSISSWVKRPWITQLLPLGSITWAADLTIPSNTMARSPVPCPASPLALTVRVNSSFLPAPIEVNSMPIEGLPS